MKSRFVDLSHEIVDGMNTHPGIAPPVISTVLSFEDSAARYAAGTVFEIRKIEMIANTGTYLDTSAHRFPGGADLADLALERIVDVPGSWSTFGRGSAQRRRSSRLRLKASKSAVGPC